MSRTVIAAVVVAVIAVLTGIALFVASTSFDERLRKDAEAKLVRAYQVVQQLNQLEGIDVSNKAERLAAEKEFVAAIKADSAGTRQSQAQVGFQKFTADEKQGAVKPARIRRMLTTCLAQKSLHGDAFLNAAFCWIALGKKDECIANLQKAKSKRVDLRPHLGEKLFAPLATDKRFLALKKSAERR